MQKRWILAGLILAGLVAVVSLGDFASDDPGFEEAPGTFEGRFLVLSDASMPATAYADGALEPFAGMQDTLTLFENGAAGSAIEASNSVISWPQVLSISADGRFAYVAETRGNLPESTVRVDAAYTGFPEGRRLGVFDLASGAPVLAGSVDLEAANLQSVAALGERPWLAVASETRGAELAFVRLGPDGTIEETRSIDLLAPHREEDGEPFMRTVSVSPDGNWLAANVANARVQFYEVAWDAQGTPIGAAPRGEPVAIEGRIATGRWAPDGRHFLISGVGGGGGALQLLFRRHGYIHALTPPSPDAPARLVASVPAGVFPEGFEISDDGTRIAAIAMGRTYLPEAGFLSNWPHRRTYGVVLLSLDPETGAMKRLDQIRTAGLLPEDVIFDETGRNLAVAVFHRRTGPDRQRGFIDFYSISETGKLVAQGRTQPVMRGPHDLVRIPSP